MGICTAQHLLLARHAHHRHFVRHRHLTTLVILIVVSIVRLSLMVNSVDQSRRCSRGLRALAE